MKRYAAICSAFLCALITSNARAQTNTTPPPQPNTARPQPNTPPAQTIIVVDAPPQPAAAPAQTTTASEKQSLPAAPGAPAAAAPEPEPHEYGAKDTIELGGSMETTWMTNEFAVELEPSFGWFFVRNWELTLDVGVTYVNQKESDGARTHTTTASVDIEPSYHAPLIKNELYFLAGVGVGYGYNGTHSEFELIPRVGLNIGVGRSGGFLTPAIEVPILFGNITGPLNDQAGALAGFAFEIGYTVTF